MADQTTVIPPAAREIIHETWETGAKKSAYYVLDQQRVGYRSWNETGQIAMEYGIHDNQMHGLFRTWHDTGELLEEHWYVQGKEHGTAKQYDQHGTLIGSYTMEHGSGVDLWFAQPGVIAEERHYRNGLRHGYERWWTGDNRTIAEEGHFCDGIEHGIFRQWNATGRLRRGYPRYYVAGQRVTKRQYERASRQDATLPRFTVEANSPSRQLPAELQQPAT